MGAVAYWVVKISVGYVEKEESSTDSPLIAAQTFCSSSIAIGIRRQGWVSLWIVVAFRPEAGILKKCIFALSASVLERRRTADGMTVVNTCSRRWCSRRS